VEEKEKSSTYDPLRKKLNQLQDFRNTKNESTIQNKNSTSENEFDFNKILSELQSFHDIQIVRPITTDKTGLLKQIALKKRNLIQNEVRFTIDPIIHKQVVFNSKVIEILENQETKIKGQIDKINNSLNENQKLVEKLNNSFNEHEDQINEINNSLNENQKTCRKIN